ncbi:MAG: hypothetical protein HWD59_02120 [Coxiellaceae bacterium]|nr:MAG: hypothetical protein HWD59_02120 [Coxiellaceae bacterium]
MKNRLLIPLFGVMFLDLIAYTVRYPVFTLAFYDIGSRLFAVDASMVQRSYWYGVCISIYLIATIISAPILSLCSDHIGRKTIILVSSIGSLSFAFFLDWGLSRAIFCG